MSLKDKTPFFVLAGAEAIRRESALVGAYTSPVDGSVTIESAYVTLDAFDAISSGWRDSQESFLAVDGQHRASLVFFADHPTADNVWDLASKHVLGYWREVSREVAVASIGYTYDPRTGQYYIADAMAPNGMALVH
jgi:hypothetical protein